MLQWTCVWLGAHLLEMRELGATHNFTCAAYCEHRASLFFIIESLEPLNLIKDNVKASEPNIFQSTHWVCYMHTVFQLSSLFQKIVWLGCKQCKSCVNIYSIFISLLQYPQYIINSSFRPFSYVSAFKPRALPRMWQFCESWMYSSSQISVISASQEWWSLHSTICWFHFLSEALPRLKRMWHCHVLQVCLWSGGQNELIFYGKRKRAKLNWECN